MQILILKNDPAPCLCGFGMAKHNWVVYDRELEPIARITFCATIVRVVVAAIEPHEMTEAVSEGVTTWWDSYREEFKRQLTD